MLIKVDKMNLDDLTIGKGYTWTSLLTTLGDNLLVWWCFIREELVNVRYSLNCETWGYEI